MDERAWQPLIDAATEARGHARAILTRYPVGAALLFEGGEVVAGANVEFYLAGLSLCAERVAVASAVSRGLLSPVALAVVTGDSPPAAPCGVCRQMFLELVPEGSDLPMLLLGPDGARRETSLSVLTPEAFRAPG
jgi:cytidine deaminase